MRVAQLAKRRAPVERERKTARVQVSGIDTFPMNTEQHGTERTERGKIEHVLRANRNGTEHDVLE